MGVGVAWTEDEQRFALALLAQNKSCSQIGLALGRTRNSVLGLLHRLREANAPSATPEPEPAPELAPAPRPAPASFLPEPQPLRSFMRAPADPAAAAAAADEPPPEAGLLEIADLRDEHCRWPYGTPATPEFRYCGRPRRQGYGFYCGPHAKLAYTPSRLADEDAKLRAKNREQS